MNGPLGRLSLLLVSLAFCAGCNKIIGLDDYKFPGGDGGDSDTDTDVDSDSDTDTDTDTDSGWNVTSVSPAGHSVKAALGTNLVVTTNAQGGVDSSTVTNQSVVVHRSFMWPAQVGFDVDGGEITVDPAEEFLPGESVWTTLTSGLRSVDGTPIAGPYVWTFMTEVTEGTGAFTFSSQALGTQDHGTSVAVGDLDGDGDLDLFVGKYSSSSTNAPNQVFLNDGSGTFTNTGQTLGSTPSYMIELADFDGDGDLDAFEANASSSGNVVWLNDGNGFFAQSSELMGSASSWGCGIGDFDGDGDVDIIETNVNNQSSRVWFNNGDGTFTDSGQSLGAGYSNNAAIGDIDGDGDLDAVISQGSVLGNESSAVWLNDGTGTFEQGQVFDSAITSAIAMGDLNGDDSPDLFFANYNQQPDTVWFNDGDGHFENSNQNLSSEYSRAVSLGDVDGDGDLDAAVVSYTFIGTAHPNKLWINNGNGYFQQAPQTLGTSSGHSIRFGDLNGDGALDVVMANNSNEGTHVWFNTP